MTASASGHPMNLVSAHTLNNLIKNKTEYLPDESDLTVVNYVIQMGLTKTAIEAVEPARLPYFKAKGDRRDVFEQAEEIEQMSFDYFVSKQLTDFETSESKHWHAKFKGYRLTDIPEITEGVETGDAKTKHSTSQQQFTYKIEYLTNLLGVYVMSGKYNPSNPLITEAAINTLLASMKQKNIIVHNLFWAWEEALDERDAIMYTPVTGLVDVSKRIKKYCASVWPRNSAFFKMIDAIKFRTIKRGGTIIE